MTLAGRAKTLHAVLILSTAFGAGTAVILSMALRGEFARQIEPLAVGQLLAAAGAAVSSAIVLVGGAVYTRMFRRSPSISVYFVTLSLLISVIDASKLLQIAVRATDLTHLAPVISRVSIAGHYAGVLALFASGLYAGGVRMQRHGTAIVIGLVLVAGLSWAIPIDVSRLPDHLVHASNMRSSLGATVLVLVAAAVLNYVQAAIANQDARQLLGAAAVALIATGREMLYYLTMPLAMLGGAIALVMGIVLFAARNYRDSLIR